MRINKLVSRLGVGVLLATVVTLAANPAYATGQGQEKKQEKKQEKITENQETTATVKQEQQNQEAITEQTAETQESTAPIVPFSSCSTSGYDISGKVTGATNCTISNQFDQDSVSPNKPLTVNEGEGFFGRTDWMFGGKIGSNAGYDGPQGGQSGSWDISKAIEDNWGDIMLVFKSGQGTTLVGYQLADGVESGTWDSPYEKAAFNFNGGNIKDVSHISVYYREGKKPVKRKVPEPTSILGLVGISAVVGSSLKRKRKSSNIELV